MTLSNIINQRKNVIIHKNVPYHLAVSVHEEILWFEITVEKSFGVHVRYSLQLLFSAKIQ